MNPEIIDLIKEKTGEPIQFTHCLQATPNDQGYPFFFPSDYSFAIQDALRVARVARFNISGVPHDLILIEHKHSTQIYLGQWNDGVL